MFSKVSSTTVENLSAPQVSVAFARFHFPSFFHLSLSYFSNSLFLLSNRYALTTITHIFEVHCLAGIS